MKKLFLLFALLGCSLIGLSQTVYVFRQNNATFQWTEDYAFFNPARTPVIVYKDTTYINTIYRTVRYQNFGSTRNDGSPNSILWLDGSGYMKRSPVSALILPWSQISSKPNIPDSLSDLVNDLGLSAQVNSDWNAVSGISQILNKPSTFTPSSHSHGISDVTGLQSSLDSKISVEVDGSITNEIELPSQSSNSGKFLGTNGSNPSWQVALISEVDGSITNEIELPSQDSQSGKFLSTNGTNPSWQIALTSEVDGSVTNEIELPSQSGNNGRTLLTNGTSVSWGKRQETYSGTTNASGVYTVTFGTAYSSAPNIQANIINGTDTQNIRTTAISTTGFTVLVRNRTDVVGLLPSWSNVSGANVDILITEK